jgi:hypothetical protein
MLKNGALCRRSGRSINGSANAMTNTFDALGMLSSMTTGIGHSPTPTIPRGDCSNCQSSQGETANYTYYGVNEDLRLNTLQRKLGTTEIFVEKYTYADNGNLLKRLMRSLGIARPDPLLQLRQCRSTLKGVMNSLKEIRLYIIFITKH